jgi:hypothetical protein
MNMVIKFLSHKSGVFLNYLRDYGVLEENSSAESECAV